MDPVDSTAMVKQIAKVKQSMCSRTQHARTEAHIYTMSVPPASAPLQQCEECNPAAKEQSVHKTNSECLTKAFTCQKYM